MAYEAIVVGASSGGIKALQEVLLPLPADFELPILIVQHRWSGSGEFMAFALNESCPLTVREAEQNERISPGHVYIAPANYHLLVEREKTISFSIDDKVCYSRPSIDVLFETAADVYHSALIGIILTGANHDGTAGLRKIRENGGLTIAQDPATAEVKEMPNAAIQENIVDKILSPTDISDFLLTLSIKGNRYD